MVIYIFGYIDIINLCDCRNVSTVFRYIINTLHIDRTYLFENKYVIVNNNVSYDNKPVYDYLKNSFVCTCNKECIAVYKDNICITVNFNNTNNSHKDFDFLLLQVHTKLFFK